MFSGVDNAFAEKPGMGFNVLTGAAGQPLNKIARDYKSREMGWVAVGDQNYGESSSREHAAMSPRHLGCRVVITRSFARIAETNLKKQGILPLTFAEPKDYDRIQKQDRLSLADLGRIAAGKPIGVIITHADGSSENIKARYSLTPETDRVVARRIGAEPDSQPA